MISLSSIRVLIVDDEPDLLEVSKEFLELDQGISADTATSAARALELIRLKNYDIIVSDYQMPEMDGIEFLRCVRGEGGRVESEIPFILFTGKGREEVIIKALNAGANFYLTKGGDARAQFAELRNMIEQSVDKHRMESELIENKEKFENIFNSANDTILILDLDGNVLEINDIGCDWLGYTKQEMLKKNIKDIDSGEHAKQVPDRMKEVLGEEFAQFETEWIAKDGKRIPIENRARRINYVGQPAFLSRALDITERKRYEETLIESELKFRTIANFTYDWGYWIGPDDHIIYCSPTCERISSYSSKELIDDPSLLQGMVYPEDRTRFNDHLETEKGTEPDGIDFRILTRKGEIRWISHVCRAVIDKKGRNLGRRISNRDITYHKLLEEALQASKKMLEDIIDFLPDATLVVDQEGRVVAWNQAIERMTDVSKEEMVGQGDHAYSVPFYGTNRRMLLDLLTLENEELKKKYDYVTRKEDILYAETFCSALYRGKGGYLWGTAASIYDDKGNRVGAIESIRNITERKLTQEALQESEEKYRLLVNSAAEAIVVEQDGVIQMVNPMAIEITALSEQELISKPFESFVHPDDLAMVLENYQKRLRGEVPPTRYPFRLVVKDGSIKWVDISTVKIDWKGRPATLNFMTDITDRKLAEDALRMSERKYRLLAENINDVI